MSRPILWLTLEVKLFFLFQVFVTNFLSLWNSNPIFLFSSFSTKTSRYQASRTLSYFLHTRYPVPGETKRNNLVFLECSLSPSVIASFSTQLGKPETWVSSLDFLLPCISGVINCPVLFIFLL